MFILVSKYDLTVPVNSSYGSLRNICNITEDCDMATDFIANYAPVCPLFMVARLL